MFRSSPSHALGRALFAAILVATVGTSAGAQCANDWLPGDGFPGFEDSVADSCLWDPDGAGPMGLHVVFGGRFTVAGDVDANHVIARDLATGAWLQLGAGLSGAVSALHVRPNGELIAGGAFGGAVARWTGSSWQSFGGAMVATGFYPDVYDFAELPNGDLAACGAFAIFNGSFCLNIASWNGSQWNGLGTGLGGAAPSSFSNGRSMAVLGNGDLVVIGSFASAGGVAVSGVASWNGSSWSALGAGPGLAPSSLHVLPGGDLLVGGFGLASGVMMSRWDGVQWQPFGPSLGAMVGPGDVSAMCTAANGDLVVGGHFQFGSSRNIVRWDGVAWSGLGAGVGGEQGAVGTILELAGGELLVTGRFLRFGQYRNCNAAIWNGAAWAPIVAGFDGAVRAITLDANGNPVVAGCFTTAGESFAESIAAWDGAAWQPLGTGLGGLGSAHEGGFCLATLPGGEVVVGGIFTTAGGVAAAGLAQWDGSSWSPVGAGLNLGASVRAMKVMPNGDLIVGGSFDTAGGVAAANIARWDGAAWSPLGAGLDLLVLDIVALDNGDLAVTGLNNVGGLPTLVARWDGSTWSPIGSLPQGAGMALVVDSAGDLLLGGSFYVGPNYDWQMLWRWDGQAWAAHGPLVQNDFYAVEVEVMALHGNGDVLVGGFFGSVDGTPIPNLARWDGSTWSPLGGGTDGRVRALLPLDDGDVLVGGDFEHAGGLVRGGLARLGTTCPATVGTLGATCASPNGPMQLTIDALPWTGGAFASTCTGIDPSAVAFSLFGFTSPGVALSSLHPLGAPGCVLWASPDASWYQPAVGGVASCTLPIPDAPSLVGAVLTHQFLEFGFASSGLTRIGSSDGRSLTIGAF